MTTEEGDNVINGSNGEVKFLMGKWNLERYYLTTI